MMKVANFILFRPLENIFFHYKDKIYFIKPLLQIIGIWLKQLQLQTIKIDKLMILSNLK